jgi:hypothetical protein
MDLREGTVVTITLGPFLFKADALTPLTAITPAIKVAKNGGTMGARSSAVAVTHDADGYYKVGLDATDTGTRGVLKVMSTAAATFFPVWQDYNVLSAAAYDEKYLAAFALQSAAGSTATLDASASAVDDYYKDMFLVITSGTGSGQTRRIIGYVGSTKVATVDRAWGTNPTTGSTFRLVANGSIVTTQAERDLVATALLDLANSIETGLTFRQAQRLASAVLNGKLSGATNGPGTVVFRNAVADSKNRVTAIQDIYGNRTTVTSDAT